MTYLSRRNKQKSAILEKDMIGLHHHHHTRQGDTDTKSQKKLARLIDKGAYFMGTLAVVANLPQLWNIWIHHNASGVSAISWTGFLLGSIFWFGYGILHKERPITIINGALIMVQGIILLGLLIKP